MLTVNVIGSVWNRDPPQLTTAVYRGENSLEKIMQVSERTSEAVNITGAQNLSEIMKDLMSTASSLDSGIQRDVSAGLAGSIQKVAKRKPDSVSRQKNTSNGTLLNGINDFNATLREIRIADDIRQRRIHARNDGTEDTLSTEHPSHERPEMSQPVSSTIGRTTTPILSSPDFAEIPSDQRLDFSCRDRCGKEISFPCACSAKCVVYGTCCEGMARDCLHILEEGRSRFGHLLTSDFFCDQESIYKIASCPALGKKLEDQQERDSPTKRTALPFETDNHDRGHLHSLVNQSDKDSKETSTTSTFLSRNSPPSDDYLQGQAMERLNKALILSAPITDVTSGFTFVNKSIYDCHNLPNASPVTWSLRLEYMHETPVSLNDFIPLLKERNSYTPLFNQQIFVPHLCIYGVVKSCKNFRDGQSPDESFRQKCLNNTDTAVVYSDYGNRVFYANRFCAYCNKGLHYDLMLHRSNQANIKRIHLHLLMSLTVDAKYELQVVQGVSRTSVSWVGGQCTISEAPTGQGGSSQVSSRLQDQTRCVTQCEGKDFTLKPDGMCKSPHSALVAIADDGLSPLCPSAISRFANFIICGLKLLSPSLKHADFHTPTALLQFDTKTQQNLYVVTLYMDLIKLPADMFYDDMVTDFLQTFNSLSLLANSFRDYRLSHAVCTGRENERVMPGQHSQTVSSRSLDDLLQFYSLYNETRQLRWTGDGQENGSTVCSSTIYSHLKKAVFHEPIYLFVCANTADFTRFEASEQALGRSKCFDYLTESVVKNSSGRSITNSSADMSIVTRFVIALLFIHQFILVKCF
ncbi:hypothetical protein RRG08_053363 [Elysia crispata]|uniref:SMB domain-containing protein n=1 Tax=Elysia crispata TaxID=231223 RepID=A0AAE0ZL62_9GAST|nr:hypothetical protein RRG08_053363 [Elysia crispata]